MHSTAVLKMRSSTAARGEVGCQLRREGTGTGGEGRGEHTLQSRVLVLPEILKRRSRGLEHEEILDARRERALEVRLPERVVDGGGDGAFLVAVSDEGVLVGFPGDGDAGPFEFDDVDDGFVDVRLRERCGVRCPVG